MDQSWVCSRCWLRVAWTRRRARVSMTIRFCWSSSCSHRHVSGIGMSLKFRFSCGMALLACLRSYWQVGGAAQESIGKTAKTQQVIERAGEQRSLWCAGGSLEIRPVGVDQRLTALWEDKHQMQAGG